MDEDGMGKVNWRSVPVEENFAEAAQPMTYGNFITSQSALTGQFKEDIYKQY